MRTASPNHKLEEYNGVLIPVPEGWIVEENNPQIFVITGPGVDTNFYKDCTITIGFRTQFPGQLNRKCLLRRKYTHTNNGSQGSRGASHSTDFTLLRLLEGSI